MRGITKSFAGVQALRGVDLDVLAGRGALRPRPERRGQVDAHQDARRRAPARRAARSPGRASSVEIPTPEAAIELGIATMYQELDVVDGLTIAENIFLGHELASGGVLHRRSRGAQPRASCSSGSATPTSRPTREVGSSARRTSRSSAWRARSRTTSSSSSWTSRPPCSTPKRSRTSSTSSRSSPRRASPSSTSRTGSKRSARSATASRCSRTARAWRAASRSPTPRPPSSSAS